MKNQLKNLINRFNISDNNKNISIDCTAQERSKKKKFRDKKIDLEINIQQGNSTGDNH